MDSVPLKGDFVASLLPERWRRNVVKFRLDNTLGIAIRVPNELLICPSDVNELLGHSFFHHGVVIAIWAHAPFKSNLQARRIVHTIVPQFDLLTRIKAIEVTDVCLGHEIINALGVLRCVIHRAPMPLQGPELSERASFWRPSKLKNTDSYIAHSFHIDWWMGRITLPDIHHHVELKIFNGGGLTTFQHHPSAFLKVVSCRYRLDGSVSISYQNLELNNHVRYR